MLLCHMLACCLLTNKKGRLLYKIAKDRVITTSFAVLEFCLRSAQGCRKRVAGGGHRAQAPLPRYLADQLNYLKTRGALSPHPVLRAPPPGFSDIATALLLTYEAKLTNMRKVYDSATIQ